MPTKQLSRECRSLRAVMDNPALPALIQSLPARDLAQLCGRIGIGDAMHIMALAPAERLVQALEASVWKTPRPGVSEVFDPRELVEWIAAWLDIGATFTAQRLAAVPEENLMLYLSQLAIVTTAPMWGFVFEPRACRAAVPLLDELPRLSATDGTEAMWIDSLAAMASAAQRLRAIAAKRRRRS
jgi:Family of unknown function (DUF6178)